MLRRTLSSLALLAAMAASIGFAPAPIYKPPKVEPTRAVLNNLYGFWHNPSNPTVVVEISSTEFAYINSGQRNNVYNLTLDLTKKPMWYDIRRGGANFVGIWKVEGDTLTLLYNSERVGMANNGRPQNFDTSGHREIYYRQKKK